MKLPKESGTEKENAANENTGHQRTEPELSGNPGEESLRGTELQYADQYDPAEGQRDRAEIENFQSNHEGAIIDRLQQAYYDGTDGVVINPGAYTHYSYAIHDALRSVFVPKVEVHISDINEREAFRKISVTAPACDLQIIGHGLNGYLEALDYIAGKYAEAQKNS
jgi:3-dehydroquinate dehydratase-2